MEAKKRWVKNALKRGQRVQVLNVNGSERVLIDGLRYFDNGIKIAHEYKLKGWVFSDLLRCIYKNIDHHPQEVFKKTEPYYFKKEIERGDHVALVDIDHCYLQIANKLKYISDRDYERLLKKYKDIKIDVCAAFTSIYRETSCTYINSKMKIDRVISCFNHELEIVRDNIINYSHSIMAGFSGDYYQRNVDGIWIPIMELDKLVGYLEELGLKFKIHQGIYLDANTLYNSESQEIVYV